MPDRIEKLRAEKRDEHDIKKQEEVLRECLMMIPDCQRRLLKAFEELKGEFNVLPVTTIGQPLKGAPIRVKQVLYKKNQIKIKLIIWQAIAICTLSFELLYYSQTINLDHFKAHLVFILGILETEQDLKETQDFAAAEKVLEEAKHQLPAPGEVHMC